ncbi:5-amino-6-(5-phosphoribosylamino)uracil reductase [Longispora fulva]|uniref:Riboflavin biosynthesis protein RibD n=1 Tax=Longispora fulva TaxID=619741 RepID=A0A8J7KSQ8_9ACTN|nr:pyrimidine deaminase RibD-like protein/dihydrofolate reductase [Longispora fulva]GIG57714.1 5-amino-6-(5-phosphoribosylamino)uracil reductase [Longispora fulva]
MYVVLSCAASIDGYLDDSSDTRLLLSNAADFDRVDEVRAGCDAIMVGGNTYRRDQPRLRIRSADRIAARRASGLPEHPLRVVVSRSVAAVDDWLAYPSIDLALKDLEARGVRRLMVEGGADVLAQFLNRGLADELHLAVAPRFVGDPRGTRLNGIAEATLAEVTQLDQIVVLRYLLRDHAFMRQAIELSKLCPPSDTAFAVGAVIVREGKILSTGYSRETDPTVHAEQAALNKIGDAKGATVYSSLEPCSIRKSGARPCADRLIEAGIARVVYAWREPPLFVHGDGAAVLKDVGIEVVELTELAAEARATNVMMGP